MPRHPATVGFTSSSLTYEELIEIERTAEKNTQNPTTLLIEEIQVADLVFQIRKDRLGNSEFCRDHVKSLMGSLRDLEQPLAAIMVTAIGDKFYLIDGHHRYSAYQSFGWSKPIPVTVFTGTVAEAEAQAGVANHEDKLAVPLASKLEHAWTLVKRRKACGGHQHSIARIVGATGRSARTIANMRSKLKELEALQDGSERQTWEQVKKGLRTNQEVNFDKWKEEKSTEIAKRLCEDVSVKLVKFPEVLALAIEKVSGKLPGLLVQQWPEQTRDFHAIMEEDRQELAELDI